MWFAILVTVALAGYAAYRYLLPSLTAGQSAMRAVRTHIAEHERILASLPADTIHASTGLLYLSEDVASTMDSTVLQSEDFLPIPGVLVYETDLFSVRDLSGSVLFQCSPDQLAMGLPEAYETLAPEDRYFYFLYDGQYGLVAQRQRYVGEPMGSTVFKPRNGDAELAYWDHFLAR